MIKGRSVEYRAAPTSPSKANAQDNLRGLKGVSGSLDLATKSNSSMNYPKELNAGIYECAYVCVGWELREGEEVREEGEHTTCCGGVQACPCTRRSIRCPVSAFPMDICRMLWFNCLMLVACLLFSFLLPMRQCIHLLNLTPSTSPPSSSPFHSPHPRCSAPRPPFLLPVIWARCFPKPLPASFRRMGCRTVQYVAVLGRHGARDPLWTKSRRA
jgi:hypothetical protein